LRRKTKPTEAESLLVGAPLPSFTWQLEQDLAWKRGPNPSLAVVELGEKTQFLLKKEFPTT